MAGNRLDDHHIACLGRLAGGLFDETGRGQGRAKVLGRMLPVQNHSAAAGFDRLAGVGRATAGTASVGMRVQVIDSGLFIPHSLSSESP